MDTCVIMLVHFLINICTIIFSINLAHGIVTHTKQGILKGGIEKSRAGRTFYSFYAIPYAEPPLSELRFKAPVPAKTWKGVRDSTILPPACLQGYYLDKPYGNEDCLYLNLYKPKITNETLLPVMVYTHGGRFMFRDALPDKYGPHYFMDRDVILITFQYRLGSLGFLSTEDEVIPGNYGLKDGVAVLRWVQNYIDDFGGDKNRVTIFGASSGGISVSMALTSPLTKGLFHRLITQSGNPFDIEKPGKARLNAWKLGSKVGCDGDDVKTSRDLLNCLKDVPADQLVSHDHSFWTVQDLVPAFPWGPVIENEKVPGAFLVDEPAKLLQRRSDIPWIMGFNSEDGGEIALTAYRTTDNSSLLKELDTNYKTIFPSMFRYEYHVKDSDQLDSVTEMFKNHFFGDKHVREDIHGFAKMCTMLIFATGVKGAVKLYKGPKYVYYYNHRNKESFAKMMAFTGIDTNMDLGVIHGDELISFYNWSSLITPVIQGIDLKVSEKMVDLWTNFAATGDPNYNDERIWNPVAADSSNINYLHIKGDSFKMKDELLKEEYEFLEKVPVDGYF